MLRRMVGTLILVSAASFLLHGCSGSDPPPQTMPTEKAKTGQPPAPPKLPPPPKKDSTKT